MRIKDSTLLPKSRNLIEALVDGVTGFATYRSRTRQPVAGETALREAVIAVSTSRGWHVAVDVPVAVSGDLEPVDYVFTHVPAPSASTTAQCVLVDVRWILQRDSRQPVGVAHAAASLARLRSRYGHTEARQDAVTTCFVLLVGSHDLDLFGHTTPMRVESGKANVEILDAFACHAASTHYGVTTLQVW